MSAPIITTVLTNPEPNTVNPQDLQGLVDILNSLLTSAIEGTFVPYVVSSSTPAVSDQDKIWQRLDGAGRPLGTFFFYNGNWRRFHNGKYGETAMFMGNPDTYFDNTGLGLMGLDWDGWAVCNGNNATPNLADRFVVFANNHSTVDGYSTDTGWLTTVTGTALTIGGSPNTTIVNTNLPNMTVQLSGRVGYDDNASGSGQDPEPIVTKKWYGNPTPTPIPILATFGANPNGSPVVPQIPVPTVPPFVTVCPVLWVGYQ